MSATAGDLDGAAALDVLRHPVTGRTYVAVDSIVDMLEGIADMAPDGPAAPSFRKIASSFRQISSYNQLDEATGSDGSIAKAHNCEGCGAIVIDARRVGKQPVVIDADPTVDGEWFPLRIDGGVPTLGAWQPGLDGITDVRLSSHRCPASDGLT